MTRESIFIIRTTETGKKNVNVVTRSQMSRIIAVLGVASYSTGTSASTYVTYAPTAVGTVIEMTDRNPGYELGSTEPIKPAPKGPPAGSPLPKELSAREELRNEMIAESREWNERRKAEDGT